MTGTYILQSKRIQLHHHETDPTCLLCRKAEENLPHFISQCKKLQNKRIDILSEVAEIWQNELSNPTRYEELDTTCKLQILLDNTTIIEQNKENISSAAIIEGLARRLLFRLHIKKDINNKGTIDQRNRNIRDKHRRSSNLI